MKIDSKILRAFINKTSLEGMVQTMSLNFTEEGIKSSISYMNMIIIHSSLKKEAFTEYEAIGEIFIKNTGFFINLLKTFTGEISIQKKDIVLKLSNNERTFNTILADEQACENVYREAYDKKEQPNKVVIEKSQLMRAVDDMKLLGEESMKLIQEGTTFKFKIGDKNYDFSENLIESNGGQDCTLGVGKTIVNYANVVDGLFEMYFGPDVPIRLEERRENLEVTTYIAPIQDKED